MYVCEKMYLYICLNIDICIEDTYLSTLCARSIYCLIFVLDEALARLSMAESESFPEVYPSEPDGHSQVT